MGNELTGRRTVADVTGVNRTARYDELIFSADEPEANNELERFGLTFSGLDEDDERENPLLPPQLQPNLEVEDEVSIDKLAEDIRKEYDPEDITLSQPTSFMDHEFTDKKIADIERGVINTAKNGNPLKGLDRFEISVLPYLPYLAAMRDMLGFNADGPRFTGTVEELHNKVLPNLHRFPSENADYASPTGNMLRKLVQQAGMVRMAKIMDKVTTNAYTDEVDHLAGNDDFFATLTAPDPNNPVAADYLDDGSFINDAGPFGSPDMPVALAPVEAAAIRSGLTKSIPLSAADMTNTKLAQALVKAKASAREATNQLMAQGLDSARVARIVRLMKAYEVTGQ